jgi:hypothetical protein
MMSADDKHFDSLRIKYFSLLLLPSCIVYLAFALRKAGGPFWQGNFFEAEYSYLLNSLAVSQGMRVLHADHPGSTLQLLGGVLLHVINFVTGDGSLVSDVLMRPELYIFSIYSLLIVILFFLVFFAGVASLRFTGDFTASFSLQLSFLLCYTIAFFSIPRMKPETLILILDVLFSIIVLYHYHFRRQNSENDLVWYYGIVIGLGVALKITFAPLVIIPLLLIQGAKKLIGFVAISSSVFIAVAANPLMNFSGFKEFLLGHLVAKKGYNRPIVEGSSGFEAMGQGMARLFHFLLEHEQVLLVLLVFFLISGVVILLTCRKQKRSEIDAFFRRLWLGLLLVLACQFLLVANGPSAKSHYIIPATGLIGLIAFVAWVWPACTLRGYKKTLRSYQIAYFSLFLIGSLLVAVKLPARIHGLEKESSQWLEASRFRKENNLLNVPTIYYYRASNIQYALAFGNELSGRHFSDHLAKYYPYCFSFHIWSRVLYGSFGNEVLQLNDIVRKYGKVLIQGENAYPPVIAGLKQEEYPIPRKKHYRMSGAVIPVESNQSLSAKVLFNGSKEWLVLVEPAESSLLFR